jgi:hypothetical protein
MKKTLIIIIIILAIGTLTFFMLRVSSKNVLDNLLGQGEKVKVVDVTVKDKLLNNKIPYFDLSDLNNGRIKSSGFINKPLVIVFWASWNVESANQLKIMDDYVLSNSKNNLISVISINSQEDMSVAKSFMRRGGYDIPTGVDANGGTTEDYHIKSLPTTFFVDKDGVIVEIYSGVLNKDIFMNKIEQLLD